MRINRFVDRKKLQDKIIGVFILLILLFPLRALLGEFFPISIVTSLWILSYIIIFFILATSCRKFVVHFNLLDIFLLLFLFLYGIRMYLNIYIEGIPFNMFNTRITVFVYYWGLLVLPYFIFKLISNIHRIDLSERLLNILFFIYIISIFICLYKVSGNFYLKMGRANVSESLITIFYGHISVTLSLIALSKILCSKKKVKIILYFFIALLGVCSMLIANSRSPMVALLLCCFIVLIRKISIKRLALFALFIAPFIFYFEDIAVLFYDSFGSNFGLRILSTINSPQEASGGRLPLYEEGLSMFWNNPILGDKFLLIKTAPGIYVHNSFIESLMSLGILGGVLYILIFTLAFLGVYKSSKVDNSMINFLGFYFVQYFVCSQFSGSLITLMDLWYSVFLLELFVMNNRANVVRR